MVLSRFMTLFLMLLIIMTCVDSKNIVTDYKSMDSWSVLDRFCFLPASPSNTDEERKDANAGELFV